MRCLRPCARYKKHGSTSLATKQDLINLEMRMEARLAALEGKIIK